MALILCPECSKQISEYSVSCPGCGCPMSVIKEIQHKRQQDEKEKKLRIKKKIEEREIAVEKGMIRRVENDIAHLQMAKAKIHQHQADKELEEYKKSLKLDVVECFDFITIAKVGDENKELTFRVKNTAKRSMEKLIGSKLLDVITDIDGSKWKIVTIEKNNPLYGLDDVMPGFAVSEIDAGRKQTPTTMKKKYWPT